MINIQKWSQNVGRLMTYESIVGHFELPDKDKVPVYAGCPNQSCFCTGACRVVIGFRDKHPLEKRTTFPPVLPNEESDTLTDQISFE